MQNPVRPYSDVFDNARPQRERFGILDEQTEALIRGSRRSLARSRELLYRTSRFVLEEEGREGPSELAQDASGTNAAR